jgi:hypothetical protein
LAKKSRTPYFPPSLLDNVVDAGIPGVKAIAPPPEIALLFSSRTIIPEAEISSTPTLVTILVLLRFSAGPAINQAGK